MLKCDFHMHLCQESDNFIRYSYRDLILRCKSLGYDVISITLHDDVIKKEVFDYAKKQGILLMPGCERDIDGCHVLLYNFKNPLAVTSFGKLRKAKRNDTLVVAPHPFFWHGNSLLNQLKNNVELFDAVEIHGMSVLWFNFLARRFAKKYNLSLIGDSDSHALWHVGSAYTLIDSKKSVLDIVRAVKLKKSKPVFSFSVFFFVKCVLFYLVPRLVRASWSKKI